MWDTVLPRFERKAHTRKFGVSWSDKSQRSYSNGCIPFLLSSRHRLRRCYITWKLFLILNLNKPSDVYLYPREMIRALDPKYTPPSRDSLSNVLIPARYKVEKVNLITELTTVRKVALTSDSWKSCSQDHYLTVTAHLRPWREKRVRKFYQQNQYMKHRQGQLFLNK